jgi:hypothetical protein
MIITENQLDEWVRGNALIAQGVIVELVLRLVAASSPRTKERRFLLADSVGQPGPDGVLNTDFRFDPFVPEGRSFWEIGTGTKAGDKATSDYKEPVPVFNTSPESKFLSKNRIRSTRRRIRSTLDFSRSPFPTKWNAQLSHFCPECGGVDVQ